MKRRLSACSVALLIPLVVLGSSACGSAAEIGTSTPSPQTSASSSTLDVANRLLVVRRQVCAWRLVRLTPASGAAQVLGTLPFKPEKALASPAGSRVLYVGAGSRLAVVETASGAVTRVSLAGLGVRSIDGATWTSEHGFLFGGSRRAGGSPECSSLYRADVRTGKVTRFRRLAGGEPSYATKQGSLIYVTRRMVGRNAKETIWRLPSLAAPRPRILQQKGPVYVDTGRIFNTPLVSPDGHWVLSRQTGQDVSVTYSLIDVDSFGESPLQLYGASPATADWGGTMVAFLQSLPSDPDGYPEPKLAVFIYDSVSCSLVPYPSPWFTSLDWSPAGDLVGEAVQNGSSIIYASAASDPGKWIKLGAGLVPLWAE